MADSFSEEALKGTENGSGFARAWRPLPERAKTPVRYLRNSHEISIAALLQVGVGDWNWSPRALNCVSVVRVFETEGGVI
jgi:hypothetical protein